MVLNFLLKWKVVKDMPIWVSYKTCKLYVFIYLFIHLFVREIFLNVWYKPGNMQGIKHFTIIKIQGGLKLINKLKQYQ